LRLKHSCITELEAQRPSRTCNESKEEEGSSVGGRLRDDVVGAGYLANRFRGGLVFEAHRLVYYSTLGSRVINKEEEGSSLGGRPRDDVVRAGVPRDPRVARDTAKRLGFRV